MLLTPPGGVFLNHRLLTRICGGKRTAAADLGSATGLAVLCSVFSAFPVYVVCPCLLGPSGCSSPWQQLCQPCPFWLPRDSLWFINRSCCDGGDLSLWVFFHQQHQKVDQSEPELQRWFCWVYHRQMEKRLPSLLAFCGVKVGNLSARRSNHTSEGTKRRPGWLLQPGRSGFDLLWTRP